MICALTKKMDLKTVPQGILFPLKRKKVPELFAVTETASDYSLISLQIPPFCGKILIKGIEEETRLCFYADTPEGQTLRRTRGEQGQVISLENPLPEIPFIVQIAGMMISFPARFSLEQKIRAITVEDGRIFVDPDEEKNCRSITTGSMGYIQRILHDKELRRVYQG